MTDKQIITDDQKKTIHRLQDECTEKTNAIIALGEQLKTKEQECEELKKQYNCYACGTCKGKEDYKNLETHHIGLRKSFDELHKQLDQLKAANDDLKKECEIWKNQVLTLDDETITVQITQQQFEDYNQLKAENENLTTINARLLGRLEVDEKDTSLVFNLDKELRQKEKEFYTAIQKVVKLKQTLAEIKEIAESLALMTDEYDSCYYKDRCSKCEVKDDCQYIKVEQILQKISECEVR